MNCFRRGSEDLHCLVTWFSTPLSLNLFPVPHILWFQNSGFDITTASMMKRTSVLLGSTVFPWRQQMGWMEDKPLPLHPFLLLLSFSHSVTYNSFVTPWAVVCQAPLSTGFPRRAYWSGLPFPSPGDLPTQGLNPHLLRCRQSLPLSPFSRWHGVKKKRLAETAKRTQLASRVWVRFWAVNVTKLSCFTFWCLFLPFWILSVFSLSSKSTLSFLAGETKTRKCWITFFSVVWFLESFFIFFPMCLVSWA